MTGPARALLVPVLLAAGVVAGLASLLLYPRDWGMVAQALLVTGVVLLTPAGRPRALLVGGWLLVVGGALLGRPEGDVALLVDPSSLFLLGTGGVLLLVVTATWPPRRLSSAP